MPPPHQTETSSRQVRDACELLKEQGCSGCSSCRHVEHEIGVQFFAASGDTFHQAVVVLSSRMWGAEGPIVLDAGVCHLERHLTVDDKSDSAKFAGDDPHRLRLSAAREWHPFKNHTTVAFKMVDRSTKHRFESDKFFVIGPVAWREQ